MPGFRRPVIFLTVIGLVWCGLPVAIHAAESTSYKFYEQFAGEEQPTMRESTTYQFRERDAADATSYKTTDAPPAVQNSSAAASTATTSTTNESGDGGGNGGGRRGKEQSSTSVREDSISSAAASAAGQTAPPTTPASPTKAQPFRQAARLATTIPAALDTHGSNVGITTDSVSHKKDTEPNEATLHPSAKEKSQRSLVVLAAGKIGVLFTAITLLLTWSSSKAMMLGTFVHERIGSWFPSSFSPSTQSLRKRKNSKKRRKSATRWYQRLFSLLLLTSLLSGTFAMGLQHAEAATTAPLRHNYSGHLLDSDGTAITAAHTFRFSYWKSADYQSGDLNGAGAINTSATNYGGWYETQSVTPNSQGYVSLELGNGTALPAMDSLATATLLGLYLQVEVKVSSAADTTYELLDVNASSSTVDRSSVLSVPFALNADMLDQRDVGTGSGSIPVLQTGGVFSKAAIPGGTNSGSFLIDADGSESATVTLQFGTSLTKRLTFDIANDRFSFSNDLFISGGITATGSLTVKGSMSGASLRVSGNAEVHGTLSATGSIRTDGNLTINDDQTSGDASVTFGQPTTNQTLTYIGTTGRFQFSRTVSVVGALSGSIIHADEQLRSSGSLVVNGASSFKGALTFGDALTDAVTVHAATWTFQNDVTFILNGTLRMLEIAGTLSGATLHAQSTLTTSGSLVHDGSTLGFYGVAPTTRPSAYTQTYSTADKTHANATASSLTDNSGGTANTTLEDVPAVYMESTIANNFADLAAQINNLNTDMLDLKQLVNAIIDDLQSIGLAQ